MQRTQPSTALPAPCRMRREHGSKGMRLRVLGNELADAEAEEAKATARLRAAASVTALLHLQREAALERCVHDVCVCVCVFLRGEVGRPASQ
jgi:hypothetical protein